MAAGIAKLITILNISKKEGSFLISHSDTQYYK